MAEIYLNDKIEKLNMSNRLYNRLRRAGIDTVEKLLDFPTDKWTEIRNLGTKSIEEVITLVDSIKLGNGEYLFINEEYVQEVIPESTSDSDTFEKSIDKMNFSNRAYNCLKKAGITNISQLVVMTKRDLLNIKNMGIGTVNEVLEKISILKKEISSQAVIHSDIPKKDSEQIHVVYSFEKSIDEMNFSKRAYNCLRRTGITNMSQVVSMTKEDLLNIKNMGIGTVNEVLEKIALLEKEVKSQAVVQSDVPFEILQIADECSDYYGLSVLQSRDLFRSIFKENPSFAGIETLVYNAYSDDQLRTGAKNKIIKICKKHQGDFDADFIREKLPCHLSNTLIVEDLLLELESEGRLKSKDNIYTVHYPSVMDYLETIKNERNKNIVLARLQGRTLEDIGNEYNIKKERTRQICFKVFSIQKKPRFEEDKYRYIFETYSLNCEDFCKITFEPITTFFYLDLVCVTKCKDKKIAKEMLTDENLSNEIKRRAERIAYKDYIMLDGVWIKKNKSELFEFIVKKYCKDQTTYTDILNLYNDLIEEKGLSEKPKLKIDSHSYENKLQTCNYVLWSRNHSLRYYDIEEIDFGRLIDELGLEQYNDITFSSLKLYRDHSELMEEYDIRDEYKLHNLLKKIWPEWGNCEVEFPKMPTINIGNVDRNGQVIDLLLKYAPISNYNLANKYEEVYGVLATTVLANYFGCIDSYLHNGVYSVEFESLNVEQSSKMSQVLTKDFYSIDDFVSIFKRELPDAEESLVNSYNIKNLGFIIYDRYLVRKTYQSSADYFRFKLLEKDIVDTQDFPRAMLTAVSFSSEKYDLRRKRIITEFLPGQYINIRRLNNVGVTEKDLEKYCDDIRSFIPTDVFFTISSIRQDGFDSELHELYFDDWFYSSVLAEDKENFSYTRCGGVRIFYSGQKKFNFSDFLEWLVEKETKIEIYDLEELCRERYGVIIDRYKLTDFAKNAGLYYDEIMETVYIDYDTYFEEV